MRQAPSSEAAAARHAATWDNFSSHAHPRRRTAPAVQDPVQTVGVSWPLHDNLVTALKKARVMPSAPRTMVQGAFAVLQRNNNALPAASQQQQPYHPAASAQHSPSLHAATHPQTHPAPPANGLAMQHSYDDARRRSLGTAGSPQYGRGEFWTPYMFAREPHNRASGPLEPPPQPPSYPTRNMPPPSSPQTAPTSSSQLGSAPRGPPTASPFAGVRDLASSHRPGMSISAILGGGEERKPNGSPHSTVAAPTYTPKSMQPPSPGRARSASMRESGDRGMRNSSPPRIGIFGEPPRTASEPRRDNVFGSPQFRREPGHSFRAFQPGVQDQPHHINGHGAPARPTSQPVETVARGLPEMDHREAPHDGRAGMFRPFGEPLPPRAEPAHRVDRQPFHNGITSHPQDRPPFSSPQAERERLSQGPPRFPGGFGGLLRDEQSSLFRPTFQPTSHPVDNARESIEGRAQEMRRQLSRPSPAPAEAAPYERHRNGFVERPLTLEDHQKMDPLHRGQSRKESEGSVHRAILNISPELNRKGRNSPLPQAVQGAQPRHIGPGGDNPGIKMEFGRMFSGLGSGVGSVTPNPHHAVNGMSTPSRMSPSSRHIDGHDMARSAVADIDQRRSGSKAGSRAGRRNGRRSRDDGEHPDGGDGRHTPDLQRNKRAKTNHATHHHHHHMHPHHHHHHHHEAAESTPGSFSMLRFNSNPGATPQPHVMLTQGHHHHHHAHPGHHHQHPPRASHPAKKPTTTVRSEKVLAECADKPRKHLGSQLYTTELTMPPATSAPVDSRIKFSSKMKPIPVFQEQENCTFTVRVPRYYLSPSEPGSDRTPSLEEICRHRQLWGTEIYTDDSDVVAAAVHSGWIKGDFGDYNDDLHEVGDDNPEPNDDQTVTLSLPARPGRPVKVPPGHDAHITVLVLPPLQSYAATNQHHILSRDWKEAHDGMSYMIHSIDFVDEGASSRFMERSAAARKNRIAIEEANRRQEAAAGLLMFANGNGTVRVGA
ncbi:hypothetical protein M409DRAFT_49390 [Zasmidium cellare ATCC 36951]|uniref:Rxt3-domain-containing protein n=1 Tax=Zasmidium cellare ATCC 36951 TaxID=1080233 RepID=A0A6A6D131_ZASCE|nr:uncharacterized protein M409DRAFT_49390 [Zasmidium cellare ATCC 36951]KAF2172875.1 hypothetical protein M409DRAFT_49390 [Zasmidium cellare ATCC 36951]